MVKLPLTLIDLLLEDAPKVINRIKVRGEWTATPLTFSPFIPIAAIDAEVFLAA
ncbi:unnamed protein product [Staurois parvus]|uniref:Uncharacterized protein n=1 Tax=Staurois parvus TaxID=386267 RepID=A0ABN9HEE2_9NEOB|nr:unnamed protein product [Staurois parvus]